jgi:hypothetical protein
MHAKLNFEFDSDLIAISANKYIYLSFSYLQYTSSVCCIRYVHCFIPKMIPRGTNNGTCLSKDN